MIFASAHRRYVIVLLGAACFFFAQPASSEQQTKEVSASSEVPAGGWKGIRLTRVAAGTDLEITMETDGEIGLVLLSEEAFGRLPGDAAPLVGGRAADRLALTVRIPESGTWYLVLDNRKGEAPREARVSIVARAPEGTAAANESSGPAPGRAPGEGTDLASALDLVERALAGTFVLDALEIDVVGCAGRNAYAAPGRILVCREFVQGLVENLEGDPRRLSDVLLFVLMHEAAHVLLDAWELPLTGNEEVADEMATVLLVMFGEERRIAAAAEFLEDLPELAAPVTPGGPDLRHPGHAQRALNLRRWAADPALARRWQAWLVPHMRTPLLERLAEAPRPWTDSELIREELARRERG